MTIPQISHIKIRRVSLMILNSDSLPASTNHTNIFWNSALTLKGILSYPKRNDSGNTWTAVQQKRRDKSKTLWWVGKIHDFWWYHRLTSNLIERLSVSVLPGVSAWFTRSTTSLRQRRCAQTWISTKHNVSWSIVKLSSTPSNPSKTQDHMTNESCRMGCVHSNPFTPPFLFLLHFVSTCFQMKNVCGLNFIRKISTLDFLFLIKYKDFFCEVNKISEGSPLTKKKRPIDQNFTLRPWCR